MKINKAKIINDPIYGLISIPSPLIFDIIEHPYFQRLRRISQMGLSYLVYPGAHHTRFHHAIGAMHLMQQAIETLRSKRIEISNEEEEALLITILLHDVGHGPFSHALEAQIVKGVHHETLTLLILQQLNNEFDGQLSLAIQIFKGQYHRKFMLQLISSQLDMDRLDYLNRDSFYSGVAEGHINSDRLIKMLNVVDNQLVLEEKSLFSVEKFLLARRLMYWQVYLHKTSLVAELMLNKLFKRVRTLANKKIELPMSPALSHFFYNDASEINTTELEKFLQLDDADIIQAMKLWMTHEDKVISGLSQLILNRKLFKIELFDKKVLPEELSSKQIEFEKNTGMINEYSKYFVFKGKIKNLTYNKFDEPIKIIFKDGSVQPLQEVSESLNNKYFNKPVTKYYLCYPKSIEN